MNLKTEKLDHWPDAKSEFEALAELVTISEKGLGIPFILGETKSPKTSEMAGAGIEL